MLQPSTTSITPQPDCYRIQDPQSQLYVRFTCLPSPGPKPRVTAKLTTRNRASRFTKRAAAEQCFAAYLAGATLDIVRCDS